MNPIPLPRHSTSLARQPRSKLFGAAAAAAILAGPISAQTTVNWTAGAGEVDPLWGTAANWSMNALPGVLDTVAFNTGTTNQTIQLTGGPFEIQALNFTANTGSAYTLQNGQLIVNHISQTADDSNVINPSVTITTKNAGTDVLTLNVTSNSLQLQGQITSGGLIKNGGTTVRLGTSGTAFNNAINGDIVINGGTLTAAAAGTAGSNNPLGGTGNVVIGNSGVTLELQAQAHYDFGRQVIANDRNFTLRGTSAAGDLGDFNMTIGKVTIGNATMTTTQGAGYRVRTAELALNAGATTTLNTGAWTFAAALSGDAATKIVKNGTSDLIIEGNTTNAASFAGDIDLNQGWLRLESSSDTNQPLGNAATTINITSTSNPILSLRAENNRVFDGVNVQAGNNNFQLDVRHIAGTNGVRTVTAGTVTLGNATMNVIGTDGFNARLGGIAIESGATAIVNLNSNSENLGGQHLRVDSLSGDATTTLRKNGGQNFIISPANNTSFLGKIEINGGGTNQIEATVGNNPVANSAGITFASSAQLNLRSAEATDFGAPIGFGPGVVNATLHLDRLGASGSNLFHSVGEVNIGGSGLPNGAIRTLTVNQTNGYDLATDGIRVDAGLTGALTTNTDVRADGLILGTGSTFLKQGGSLLALTSDNSATASGAILLRAGTITPTVAGALGTGLVTVGDTVPNSAGFLPNASRLNWNIAGASANATGVDAVAVAGGAIDLNVNPGANDVFEVQAGGRLQGSATQLNQLTVGTNLILGPDAIIVHDNPGATALDVNNLPTDASLYYGISATAQTLPAIGAGTPWKGVAADNTSRLIDGASSTSRAVISINGGDNSAATVEATFQSMFNANLDFSSDYTFATTAANGEKVTLAINSTQGSGFGNVPGGLVVFRLSAAASGLDTAVDKIIVENGGLSLSAASSLGGVPVEVRDNGLLDIANADGNILDGDVTFRSGGMFVFNDARVLGGTGTLTFESGSKLDLTGGAPATFFTDATQPLVFTGTGHTVRFVKDDVVNLDSMIPDAGAVFVVSGGTTAVTDFAGTTIDLSVNTQTAGLSTDGGVIANDGTTRGLVAPLTIGANGATFTATRNSTLVIGSAVNTIGNVQVGSLTPIDNRDRSNNATALNGFGQPDPYNSGAFVWFGNDFTANNVTVNHHHVGFTDADVTINGNLTVNGAVLYLDGGGSTGGTQGELTPKLAAGTLADQVVLGEYTRVEMGVALASDSNATILEIDQPFVINGAVNPQDNRSMWVERKAGTNDRVNFNNITLNSGAELAFDESNTNIRAAVKVAGNSTIFRGAHDDFDLLSVTRDNSLPAFDGSNPVVVTLGKMNQTGIQGFNNTFTKVYGPIGAGVQMDIVRGEVQLTPSATVDGVIRAQTAAAGGTAFMVSTSDSTSNTFNTPTTIGGIGRIELGRSLAANGPEDLELRGTEVTAAAASDPVLNGLAPLHTHASEIRIVNDGDEATLDGIIRSNRMNDSDRTARLEASNVVLAPGAWVQYTATNSTLAVPSTTLQGNGTVEVNSAGISLGAVNAGSNALTLQGSFTPTFNGPITAGQLNVNGFTMAVDLSTISGGLSVGPSPTTGTSGLVTATGNVAGALTVDSGSVTLNGSVGNGLSVSKGVVTFTGSGMIKTVAGPVSLDGATVAAEGIVDFGNAVLTSTAPSTVAGLVETRLTGNVGLTASVSAQFGNGGFRAEIRGANIASPSPELYVYTGQFFDADGIFTFAENFDDNVQITVDGVMVLRNNSGSASWATATSTATKGGLVNSSGAIENNVNSGTPVLDNDFGMGPSGDGWHNIEVRLYNSNGGGGPATAQGWTNAYGVGFNPDGTTDLHGSNFIKPVDPGDATLFRATQSTKLTIAADSLVRAGGMTNVGAVNLTGANSYVVLDGGFEPAVASSAGSIVVSAGASGSVEVTRAGDSFTVSNLDLDGSLALSGEGDFVVIGDGTGTGALAKLGNGKLTVDGSITGATTVDGGILNGDGTFLGGLALMNVIVTPGHSPGKVTASNLTADANSIFNLEISSGLTAGGSIGGAHYDQFVVTGDNVHLAEPVLGLQVVGPLLENDVLTLVLNNGLDADPGSFFGYTNGATINLENGYQVQISYFDDASTAALELAGGNDVSLLVTVPEPASAVTLLAGLATLVGFRRSRRRS